MAYHQNWDSNKLNRFLKEGRGQGEKQNYKPWLTMQDFPTLGQNTRILGATTGRIHNFFSNLQLKYFYLLEWEESVVDIREHYPLLDINEVIIDQSDLKFEIFRDKETNEPYILSTSFFISIKESEGSCKHVARSVKAASELNKKITLEKLEIERRYWEAKGIEWSIVTNKEINSIRAKNIEWVHSTLISTEFCGLNGDDLYDLSEGLFQRLICDKYAIRKLLSQYEQEYCLDPGTGILIFKYLIATRRVVIDMDKPINLSNPCKDLIFSERKIEGGEQFGKLHG